MLASTASPRSSKSCSMRRAIPQCRSTSRGQVRIRASSASERQLEPMAFPQPGRVGGRRHEAGAAQVKIAFARPFGRQSQAVPEFQFRLEEVASQPVDRLGGEFPGADRLGAGPSDHSARFQHDR